MKQIIIKNVKPIFNEKTPKKKVEREIILGISLPYSKYFNVELEEI